MKMCESINVELNEGVKDFIKKTFKIDDASFEKN